MVKFLKIYCVILSIIYKVPWNIKAKPGEFRFMILGNKVNNELSVYVKTSWSSASGNTFGEECNFKKHIENIPHVAKYNLLCHVRIPEWIYTL